MKTRTQQSSHASKLPEGLRSSHAIQLPEGLPEWVQLLPAGQFSGRDGRGPYVTDAQAVLGAFAEWGMPLAIDYEHQSLKAADKTDATPAAGWIQELEARADGIWGRVEWTPRAAQMLQDKEYRYLSPVFHYAPKTGQVVRLIGAGLTNNPNLYLQAAASRQEEDAPMLERLRALFGLTDADEAAVVDHVTAMHQRDQASTAQRAELAKTVGLAADAELPAIAQAVQSRVQAGPDLNRFVPRSQYDEVATALNSLQASVRAQEVEQLVSAAMQAGKIAPATETWAREYCGRDPQGFGQFVDSAPVITAQSHAGNKTDQSGKGTLSEVDLAVCRNMGLDPDTYAKHLEGK